MSDLPPLWAPQSRTLRGTTDALAEGCRRICVCSPTGSGKSRIICELARDHLHCGEEVAVYTNRKMLREQMMRVMSDFGLSYGVRAAGCEDNRAMPLQISSIQTEASRVLTKKTWQLHKADLVIIDEAHLNAGDTAKTLLDMHLAQGASYVGFTATPLDIGHLYDHLIIGGTNSEFRECGAIVPAIHFGPDEPDTKKIKKASWEYTENDVRQIMQVQKIVGRVIEWYNVLNPERKPAILFAPGVPESIWFAEELCKAGIEAAHIDGRSCFYKGERYESDKEVRAEILRASKAGEVKVLCNRFVLREGIDAPWIEHMILATVFGSLQSYLQSVGRGLRAFLGKMFCIVQDHGGNWWRHHSANADRQWNLTDSEATVQGLRQERLRNKIDKEPMRCPNCARIIMSTTCPCGFQIKRKSRPVIMENGDIKEHGGDIFRPRYTRHLPDTLDKWTRMYFRSKNKKRTFNQARGLFCYENGYFPPPGMPFMPKNERDWFRHVNEVDRGDLT